MTMTNAALKVLLNSPICLFGLMLLASFSNALTQLGVVKQTGKPMTCVEYFVKYIPETVSVLISNVLGFVVLVMTDQLNFASAIGVGYGINSLVDLLPKTRRSYDLKITPDDPAKVPLVKPPENPK